MPKPLDLGRLQKFEPSGPTTERGQADLHTAPINDRTERWPSREPVADGQISIKGPLGTIRRFKTICKEDRRTYADMLSILMDEFERKNVK
jgi:hypothetical protein